MAHLPLGTLGHVPRGILKFLDLGAPKQTLKNLGSNPEFSPLFQGAPNPLCAQGTSKHKCGPAILIFSSI